MTDKPFDPFRYSVETVPRLVRRDLARMTVPELGAEELEPPAALKQRLGDLSGDVSRPLSDPPSAPAPAPETRPAGAPVSSPRRLSKPVMLALGVALASLAAALLRS